MNDKKQEENEDWFSRVLMSLPEKPNDNKFIKITGVSSKLVFMNPSRTIGLTQKTLASKEYLDNCTEMTWDEFRRQNILNAISGEPFYQPHYILDVINIFKALGWGKYDITVWFPKIESPVMFGIGSESEFALFIAPCKPRDWSSVAPIKTTESKP